MEIGEVDHQYQTSRRQKYFTGHSVWLRAIFHRTESKFAGPKSLSGILTNKSEISLVATFLALANTIILCHAVSSLKKLLARFVSLLLLWQKNLWDVFICFPLFRGLAQLRPFFSCNQFQTCFGPPGSYCSCIHVCHRTLTKSQSRRVFHCSIRVLSTLFAPYFWFLINSAPLEVPTVLFFHETAPQSNSI